MDSNPHLSMVVMMVVVVRTPAYQRCEDARLGDCIG